MQKENLEALERFFLEKRANEIAESSLKSWRLTLTQLDEALGKPFKEATREDVMTFFTELQKRCARSTVHVWKGKVKTFYNWLFQLAPREYPDCVKWLRVGNPRRGTKTKGYELPLNPEDLLSKEDVLMLVNACDHPRNAAIISVMYETACEPFEALNMKVKSFQPDKHGGVVTLEGETSTRRIRIVDSVPYLEAWLNVHPLRNRAEAPLWIVRKGMPEALGYTGLYRLVKMLKRRTGLKKPLRPNYLRHASLTEWAKILPEQKLKVLAGWTPSSRMAAVYIHLAGKDLDEDILKAHGKAPMKPEKLGPSPLAPKPCPRCKHENAPTHLHCARCGMILDKKTALAMEKQKQQELAEWLEATQSGETIVFLKKIEGLIEVAFKEIDKLRKQLEERMKD